MKNIFLFGAVLFTLAGSKVSAHQDHSKMFAHLSFTSLPVHAHLSWEKPPALQDYAIMRLEFRKASDHALTDVEAQVQVDVSMPDMDHGNVPTETERLETGVYRVRNISLFMNGTWEIAVKLTLPDGQQETQVTSYEMGDGGDGDPDHDHGI